MAALLATACTQSVPDSPSLLQDFKKVGAYIENFRSENGTLPTTDTLQNWLKSQKFKEMRYTNDLGMPLSLGDAPTACRQKSDKAMCTYLIHYSFDAGSFVNEYWYDPVTGKNNIPG